jgi:hypothetical protein
MDKTKRMGGTRTYQSTMVKLSPNSKAYKAAYKRNKLTGNPDIYDCSGKWVDKKDAKNIIKS